MTDPKLLPCPFCGKSAREPGELNRTACIDGDCCGSDCYTHVKQWNTRPPLETPQKVAGLGAALKHSACYSRVRSFCPEREDQICRDQRIIEEAAKKYHEMTGD